MKHRFFAVILALLLVASAAPKAFGALDDVGIPIAPHGFPAWYEDSTGLKLEPCLPPPAGNATLAGGGLCVHDPLDPASDLVVAGEIFWWLGSARMNMPGGGEARLVLGIEGTFGGNEEPVDGQQISFGRVRIRVDTPVAGDYTVTHPYGTITFNNVPAGGRAINYTADIGAANFLDPAIGFRGTLTSPIGPFLTWPGYDSNPGLQLTDPGTGAVLEQYVGNPDILNIVTGSPSGNNFFRVQGPGGLNVQTNLFSLMGKVYDPSIPVTAHVFPGVPDKKLYGVGPVNRVNFFAVPSVGDVTGVDHIYSVGYPIWYQDNFGTIEAPAPGIQLTLCPPGNPMCISDPIDPGDPDMAALRTGGEGFWWSAGADIDITPDHRARLFLGLEATFGGDEAIADGQQIAFGRLRIRVDTPFAGDYTITHPYGTVTYNDVPADGRGINQTVDIGIVDLADPDGAFVGALYSDIGPRFLTWPGYDSDPGLQVADPDTGNVVQYVGNPNIPHVVTGSPTGDNFFRIQGPNGLDVQTDLFSVSGKIYDPLTFEFPAAPMAAFPDTAVLNLAQNPSVTIHVLDNDTYVAPVTVNVLPAGANFGPDGGTTFVNLDNSITYTPNAGFSGQDTFVYNFTNTLGATSNNAIVTVTVIPVEAITVSSARLRLGRLRWDIRGTGNIDGSNLTVHAGPSAAGPVIGTAFVADGRWRIRATTTTNPDVNSISIISSTGAELLNQPLRVQ